MLILVADESPACRQSVKDFLVSHGYTVIEAATGIQAVARYLQFEPHLVLLEYTLPDVSGLEVGRALYRFSQSVALVLYGELDSNVVLRAYQVGFRDCLSKPLDHQRLLRTVQSLLPRPRAPRKKRVRERYTSLLPRP